ncbi:MAG: TetR/AcrR family transcriptional regulator [Solirubrobacterales bacterium]
MAATNVRVPGGAGQRAKILDAAQSCFADAGLAGTTLDQIRARAGISVGGLYHHFDDKLDVAGALYLEGLEAYQLGLLDVLREQPDAGDGIRAGVSHHVRWWTRNRQMASFLDGTPALRALPGIAERLDRQNRPFYSEVLSWWRGHVHYGALRDIGLDLGYSLWLGPADSYCRLWDADRAKRPGSGEITTLADAAWASVRAKGG